MAVIWVLVPGEKQSHKFPRKPVTLLVAYSPGGAVDTVARLLARYLEPELGQRVVVKNLPGAGGQIGYTSLANASNDGYQLGFITAPSIQMLKLLRPEAAFSLEDFTALANIQGDPVLLLVRADSPYKTFSEFISAAREQPGSLTVSGDGPLSNNQLQLAVMEQQLDVVLNFVPFSGSGPALTALLGGQVNMAVPSSSSAAAYVNSGKLRALAIFADKPLPGLESVPTIMAASGVSVPLIGMALRGVVAPAGIPEDRMQILEKALAGAVSSPGFQSQAKSANLPLAHMNATDYAIYLAELNRAVKAYLPLLSSENN